MVPWLVERLAFPKFVQWPLRHQVINHLRLGDLGVGQAIVTAVVGERQPSVVEAQGVKEVAWRSCTVTTSSTAL